MLKWLANLVWFMEPASSEAVTQLLIKYGKGDRSSVDEPPVYGVLRRLAVFYLTKNLRSFLGLPQK
jgi:hypothetical protein